MVAELVKGAPVAKAIRAEVDGALVGAGVVPCLVNVVVGDQTASASYLDAIDRAAAKRGITSRRVALDADARQEILCEAVDQAARDDAVHGLMIQQPLPPHLDAERVTELIPPAKDVDGATRAGLGAVLSGVRRHTAPATAAAVVALLASDERLDPRGRDVVVVGRSLVVGRPLAAMLAAKVPGGDATVTLCHTRTTDVAAHTRRADVVVVAAGVRHVLTAEMVRPGAVVVDVGTHAEATDDGWTLTGDVHPDVADVAGFLTPVPGGVGPVTNAVLMRHVAAAAGPGVLEPAW